ncbi:MAG: hypothetical protein A2580_04825 [Hydrogenophilales bacterium RIFOXYD1_FULL_62_11]|nr:MAG: hypothetical protein A2580_04825 [Hydrogenophilales bacterium RIFOXYD1_FULL_62_11]
MNPWLGGLRVGNLAIPLAIFIVAPLIHLVFFHYFLPSHFGGRSELITGIFYALLVLWLLATALANRPYCRFKLDQVDILFLVFLTGIGISATLYGLNPWLKYAPFFMVAPYFVSRLLDFRELRAFFTALTALCIVATVLVSSEIADTFGRSVLRTYISLFGYDHGVVVASNVLGMLLVLVVAYLAYPRRYKVSVKTWAAIFMLPWLVALLVDLQSRAGLYGALLVSAVLIVLSKENLRARMALAVYLCSAVIVSGILLTPGSSKFLLAPVTESASSWNDQSWSSMSSVQQRKVLYATAVREFVANPVVGVGAGRFAEVSGIPGAYPHNSVLQAFTELGVIGGILYTGIAVLSVWRLFGLVRGKSDVRGELAWYVLGLWAYLFMIELAGGNYLMSASFWLVSGLAVSLIKSGGETANRSESSSL